MQLKGFIISSKSTRNKQYNKMFWLIKVVVMWISVNFKEIAIPLKISRLDSLHTFSLPATWVMIMYKRLDLYYHCININQYEARIQFYGKRNRWWWKYNESYLVWHFLNAFEYIRVKFLTILGFPGSSEPRRSIFHCKIDNSNVFWNLLDGWQFFDRVIDITKLT